MTTRKAHTRTTSTGKVTQVRRHSVDQGAAAPPARRAPQQQTSRRRVAVEAASTASLGVALAGGLVRIGVLLPLAIVTGVVTGLTAFITWQLKPKRRKSRGGLLSRSRHPVRRSKAWVKRKAKLRVLRTVRRLRKETVVASTKRASNVVPIRKGVTVRAPAKPRARRAQRPQ